MPKVCVLTAQFGEGHLTAARNIVKALPRAGCSGEPILLDPFHEAFGWMYGVARQGYGLAISQLPTTWRFFYNLADSPTVVGTSFFLLSGLAKVLRPFFEREKPDVVVSTYAIFSHVIDTMYPDSEERPFAFVTVVTDSISVNSVWLSRPSDHYVAPNEATASVLKDMGAEPKRVHALGFPVDQSFAEMPTRSTDLPERPRLLVVCNEGPMRTERVARLLLSEGRYDVTFVAGRSPQRHRVLEKLARNPKLCPRSQAVPVILGWVDNLPELMRDHDVLLTKAGGAIIQEAIAARLPVVITQIVPGQEEGNARLIVEGSAGIVARRRNRIKRALRRIFDNDAAIWREWVANIAQLGVPDASDQIARFLVDVAPLARDCLYGIRSQTEGINLRVPNR